MSLGSPSALRRSHRVKLAFLGALLVLGVGAVGVVHFPQQPGQAALSAVFTVLMAVPAGAAFLQRLGARRGLAILALLSVFGFAIEGTGVATGWPYGAFRYGDALGPKLLGLVPWTLPFSWVPLVLAAVALASSGRKVRHPLVVAFIATAYLVAFDLVLDPAATRLGFWSWQDPAAGARVIETLRFYDVPLSNFLGWIVSSLAASLLLLACLRIARVGLVAHPTLLGTWAANLVFWTLVNALLGFVLPALLGVTLAGLTAARLQLSGTERGGRDT